jgi:hypothetical protein
MQGGLAANGSSRSGRPDDKLHSVTHHAERWVSLRSTHPTKRNDDQRKRKRNADRRVSPTSAPSRARRASNGTRSPIGVPLRLLLQRTNAAVQLQIRTSWDLVGRSDPKASNNRVRKTVRFFSGRYMATNVNENATSRRPSERATNGDSPRAARDRHSYFMKFLCW